MEQPAAPFVNIFRRFDMIKAKEVETDHWYLEHTLEMCTRMSLHGSEIEG